MVWVCAHDHVYVCVCKWRKSERTRNACWCLLSICGLEMCLIVVCVCVLYHVHAFNTCTPVVSPDFFSLCMESAA